MAFLIRPATASDAADLAAIYRPYVEESQVSFEEVAPGPEEMARRITGDTPGLYPWFLAEEAGRTIGYAASSAFRTRPAYRWIVETGIYLSADAHGRGVGRALLSHLLRTLQTQGFVAAIGAIALPNEASVALHEKVGFAYAGAYRGVGFKFGRWMDVGLWQKELAPRTGRPAEPKPFVPIASVR